MEFQANLGTIQQMERALELARIGLKIWLQGAKNRAGAPWPHCNVNIQTGELTEKPPNG